VVTYTTIVDTCEISEIPSGFIYDSLTGLYYDISESTVEDEVTGIITETTTTLYYDCSTTTYTSTSVVTTTVDTCAAANIPSGYTYDSSSGEYINVMT
jgi:hypothetical protein